MRYEGSLSFLSKPTAVWRALIDPAQISCCMPGLISWQAVTPDEVFQLQMSWLSQTSHEILIPVQLCWNKQNNWRLAVTAVAVVGANYNVHAEGNVALQASSTREYETDLSFTASVTTPNKMMDQMVHAAIPKMTASFFKCFRKSVDKDAFMTAG